MMRRAVGRIGLPLTLGLVITAVWLAGLRVPVGAAAPSDRGEDPVLLDGADLPADFLGAPIGELVAYRYDGGWTAVPTQIDQRSNDITATFTTDDGDGFLLDANDELALMAKDAGGQAAIDQWPDDPAARAAVRAEIAIVDPLDPGTTAWLYLYRSPTLVHSPARYVDWDEPAQTLTAVSYTAAFSPNDFVGLADLIVNGHPTDLLDRQKLRAQVTVRIFGIPVTTTQFTEESLSAFITAPLTITLPISGPVRAVGGDAAQGFAFYGARADLAFSVDLSDRPVPGVPFSSAHVDYLALMADLRDPAASGLAPARYFDGNGADVPIDGLPDAVPAAPPGWTQIQGAPGGWVSLQQVDAAAGTLSHLYEDDATLDPADTGDGRRFGQSGFRVDDPNGVVTAVQHLFITPTGAGSLGGIFQARLNAPLTATAVAQSFDPGPSLTLFLPIILRE